MKKRERKPTGNSIIRLIFVGLTLLIQIAWLLVQIMKLSAYSSFIYTLTTIISVFLILRLYSKHTNTAMKMPWIMLILALPVMGISLYLIIEILGDPGVSKRLKAIRAQIRPRLSQDGTVPGKLSAAAGAQSRYLLSSGSWPVYENTALTYYPEADQALTAMKEALEAAEHFIFMEYFIIEDGSSFQELEEILVRKAKAGVDVRLMYDDIGSVGYVNMRFAQRLNREGIRCYPFNPALPLLNLFMNHRDHRKITVIDGKVGFTGGYNLADEYFNRVVRFGHWKDTGLRLEGPAVRSLTAAFLELWAVQSKKTEDWDRFLAPADPQDAPGFCQPFADDPLGLDRLAEDVYLNLISQSREKLWFLTPYLIITDEMSHALGLAAKRGVDVRIITPGIPDKKTVYAVTRSYYAGLVSQGVRIFEYTPGFCHAKMCLCDGHLATVGTSNLDYRSLYHHFENNVLLMDCPVVEAVEQDFRETFPLCREVTDSYRTGRGAMLRTWQYILRLFAPLI